MYKKKILLAILITSICFYFTINIIINEDVSIVNSFNMLFFKITPEELSLITLGFNAMFYSWLFFSILKTKKSYFKWKIENVILIILLIFIPYIYILIFDQNIFDKNFTVIMFLIYTSLFIFGFLLLTSISTVILIYIKPTNNIFYTRIPY